MKNLLLFLSFVFIFPAWALCPVDSGVCSISDLPPAPSPSAGIPLFKQNANDTNNDMNNTVNAIQPTGLNNPFSKTQNPSGVHMQGSLGCQFGNCNRGANNDFLENQ